MIAAAAKGFLAAIWQAGRIYRRIERLKLAHPR